MKTTASLVLCLVGVSCVGRDARGERARPTPIEPLTAEQALAAFDQTVGTPSDEDREGDRVEAYASLFEAVAQHPCESGTKGCELIVAHRHLVKGESAQLPNCPELEPIEEVVLVSHALERRCQWSLAARSRVGWLEPIDLGTSAAGCRAPLDDGAIENNSGLWFPLSFVGDGLSLRIEAQTHEYSDALVTVWDEPSTKVTVSPRREVLLCRVHPYGRGTLACATESEALPPMTGDAKTLFAAAPVPAGSKLLPLGEASRVSSLPARWILAPRVTPEPSSLLTHVFSPYRDTHLDALPLGPNLPTVLIERLEPKILVVDRGETRWVGGHHANYANESLTVTRTQASPGLVRVDLERVVDGPTRVTWRFTELVTATHHVRLATGVEIATAGATVRAWTRRVEADQSSVTLSAATGALAWFRGTGRFTYEELELAVPRWRAAFAQAWLAVSTEPTRFPGEERSELLKSSVGRLVTIPGFAEPTNWTVVDSIRPLRR
ncbi:MAG TPA: hypothetical protein PK095_13835 [Myxococcota bacterium]|nr:hypothetical protein [Myxococcota bacterium]